MKARALVFPVMIAICLTSMAAGGLSASGGRKPTVKPVPELSVAQTRLIVTCDDIDPELGSEYVIEHNQIGHTWYDFQQNCSLGRMISVTSDGHRHFSWTFTDGPYVAPNYRYVDADCMIPAGPHTGQIHVDGGADKNAGYSNQTHLSDGTSVVAYHRVSGTPIWYSTLAVDDVVCGGFFTRHWDIPDYIVGATEPGMWPKAEVLQVGSIDYIHVVMTEGLAPEDYQQKGVQTPQPALHTLSAMVAYERCYRDQVDPNILHCEWFEGGVPQSCDLTANQDGPGAASPISHFDVSCGATAVVAVSPVSEKVAIVYLKPVLPGACDDLSDVCFVESMVNGDDWVSGSNWPPLVYNVTTFTGAEKERAFNDVSACYDFDDNLHIVYVTTDLNSDYLGYRDPHVARLYHWNAAHGVSMISYAIWGGTDPGAHNLNVAKMNVSALDPIYNPGPGSAYLYAVWTQFDTTMPQDNSDAGYTNGNIYGCGSSDGGNTWGKPYNLTNTKTPGCTGGDCVSEHWSSLARNMYDGGLHIQYVCDRDAGAAVMPDNDWLDPEGEWTDNPVMYLHLTAWDVTPEPRCYYRILTPEHWYHPPLKVQPNSQRTLEFEVTNIGNSNLLYSVVSDHQCIHVAVSDVLPPGGSIVVPVVVDGQGVCNNTFIDGNVVLTTSEGGGRVVNLPVQAVVADDYFECPRDPVTHVTLDNTKLRLYANANGELRIHDIGTFAPNICEVFFRGGVFVATTLDGDALVGRYMGENDQHACAREQLSVINFRLSRWVVTSNTLIHRLEPPADYRWYWWEVSTQTLFFMDPHPLQHSVVTLVTVERHDPPTWWPDQTPFTTYDDTYVGVAMDVDCPWSINRGQNAPNFAGYNAVNDIAWTTGNGTFSSYACGIAQVTSRWVPTGTTPYGAHNVLNQEYIYPQEPWGWDDEELYQLAATSGQTIQSPGVDLDRSWVITGQHIPAGNDQNKVAGFVIMFAINEMGDKGLEELQAHIDSTRAWVAEHPRLLCGDCNCDGEMDLEDVVCTLNYLFRGEPSSCGPIGRLDCNGSGAAEVGDLIVQLNYLFKGYSDTTFKCRTVW